MEKTNIEQTDFTDKTFRVTGRELLVIGKRSFLAGMALVLHVFMVAAAAEALFGAPGSWRLWVGTASAMIGATLIVVWMIWRFYKPDLDRWLDERRIRAEGFIYERPSIGAPAAGPEGRVLDAFKAMEQVCVDLNTGEESWRTSSQRPPEQGGAASVGPSG